MPYFIRSTRGLSQSQMLVEMPTAQTQRFMKSNPDTHYSRVSGKEAHDWVKGGNIHETDLYVDDVPTASYPYSRRVIRRARGGEY